MKRFFITSTVMLICLSLLPISAEDSFSGYHQADTAHFTFVFDKDSKTEAGQFARFADTAWQKIARIYGMPQEKTKVMMSSNTDVINAFAMADGFYMGMYTNPNNIVDFGFRTDWHELFFTHELIHIANMNFEGRRPQWMGKIGSYLPLIDTGLLPGYAMEGLTTVLETELTAGGRGRSPYFELFYKAPAMENNMVDYTDIGNGYMMPRGQEYVYGYLLTRTIADSFGLTALADIERNRSIFGNWETSVYQITGKTPEYLFNDAKKALDKRYAQERTIPEGITLSPHTMGKSYYPKAVIQDDKSIISLSSRTGATPCVVRYIPETDEEKILFKAGFNSDDGFTASGSGTVVFTSTTTITHQQPGERHETDLYLWNDEQGIRQLTSGSSYFQPAVSRNGNRLVAIDLENGHYRIVEVSLKTGETTVILEDPDKSYIQPSLSDNGTYLTCLELTGTHASVIVCNMPSEQNPKAVLETLHRVYNDVSETAAPTEIMDPGYPAFVNDKVTFCTNERGRLEVFECDMDGSHPRPVVSDPVGALWCYPLHDTLYYGSYASTGYVVKVKPVTAWGDVPDFEGPSKPGEIITLKNGLNDYPEFIPYHVELTVSERDETFRQQAENDSRNITSLNNERRYTDLPHLLLAVPNLIATEGEHNTIHYGYGFAAFGMSHMMQNNSRMSIFEISAEYTPELQQITGNLLFTKNRGASSLLLDGFRTLLATSDNYTLKESTGALVSYSYPLYTTTNYFSEKDTALIAGVALSADRSSSHEFTMTSSLPYTLTADVTLGLETYQYRQLSDASLYFSADAVTRYLWKPESQVSNLLYEGSAGLGYEKDNCLYGVDVKGRWFDVPKSASVIDTISRPNANNPSTQFPGLLIADVRMGSYASGFLLSAYLEKFWSFGTNSYDWQTPATGKLLNFDTGSLTYLGLEASYQLNHEKMCAGVVLPAAALFSDDYSLIKFYASIKSDGIRYTISSLR